MCMPTTYYAPQEVPTVFLDKGFSPNLESTSFTRLASQQASGICLSPHHRRLDYKCMGLCSEALGSEDQTQVLVFVQQTPYQQSFDVYEG